ncbi:zinc finger protein 184 [Oryzias melastigma]|uniref:zinc finger protein 184 n=1 Tax=Oryzias melastigma TaxID=30732 RepID=UPI000CF82A79|nr:zinc finger protein 184 [Oryzias melastigma]
MSSEPQEDSHREQLSAAEGTIVQNEEELCGQRGLICWNPELQLHVVVLPQGYVTDLCNQQRNVSVELQELDPTQIKEEPEEQDATQIKEEPEEQEPTQIKEDQEEQETPQIKEDQEEQEPPQIKEDQEEQEPPQIKEDQEEQEPPQIKEEKQEEPQPLLTKQEQEGFCISQDEEQLDLKQETETLMEIPTYEGNGHSEGDLNHLQSFNVSPSTTVVETDPQKGDQVRRDRCQVQNVDSPNTSGSRSVSDICNNSRKIYIVMECKQSPKENELTSVTSGKRTRIAQEPYVSEECDETSGNKFRNHSSVQTKRISCIECNKKFSSVTCLKTHIRTHTQPFSCNKCDKSFTQSVDLRSHLKTHAKVTIFSCDICDDSFGTKSSLKAHKKIHERQRRFSCKECDESFTRVLDLKAHMRTHPRVKLFSCSKCDNSFSEKSSLKAHMRTHEEEKRFSCNECDETFTQVDNLKAHMRTHEERPFSCNECDESFTRIVHLKSHMSTHSRERPFFGKVVIKDLVEPTRPKKRELYFMVRKTKENA